ncbi:histidine kinase [Aliivibrio fischeri]|uniref:histidine kinase n=1 Tax=Aliivibrio fischeri TaxID=668 RepID=UPI0012DA4D90|nr:histidine kinase [Aliivibrio fischeri]MUJ26331.1 histidine kinase [Aliivibrio fischeri]
MSETDNVYRLLKSIVESLNYSSDSTIVLNQQLVNKSNMSLSGANGRLWVSPALGGFDISISGLSLEKELSPKLEKYFDRLPDGYKQKNSRKGFLKQPFWRVKTSKEVEEVCIMYSKTIK